MKVQKSSLNYTNSSCANFNEKCPKIRKCPDTPQLYTTEEDIHHYSFLQIKHKSKLLVTNFYILCC